MANLAKHWVVDEGDEVLCRHGMELLTGESVLVADLGEEHLANLLALGVVCVAIGITKPVVDDAEDVAPWLWVALLEQHGFEGDEEHEERAGA